MKKQMICTFMMLHTLIMVAGNVQESFLKGNAAYLAGTIDAALKLYQSMESKGPAVFYNIGNCYYRMGNYPEAIVHWRRAQKNVSWSEFTTLETYIAQAYEALGMAHDLSFMSRMQTWVSRVVSLFLLVVLQLLFLFCFIALLLLVPRIHGHRRYYIMVVLSILAIFSGIACINKYRDQQYPYGIVTKNSISVYAGPGSDYARLTEAKMLDRVRVYQSRDGWLKVHVDQFGYGWIQNADLAML